MTRKRLLEECVNLAKQIYDLINTEEDPNFQLPFASDFECLFTRELLSERKEKKKQKDDLKRLAKLLSGIYNILLIK